MFLIAPFPASLSRETEEFASLNYYSVIHETSSSDEVTNEDDNVSEAAKDDVGDVKTKRLDRVDIACTQDDGRLRLRYLCVLCTHHSRCVNLSKSWISVTPVTFYRILRQNPIQQFFMACVHLTV
ncbi:hypothetical protein RRG08_015567 [Elysia crispata]|uniref:Uncharacterized protein n=1 Tax=Elysia crispata TaxID=231223 RepID=A0AAE0YJ40_9GAST|nr:hypothetical protein RRG08_015567 [Elysia crispata]